MSARLFAALALIILGALAGRLAAERLRRRCEELHVLAGDMDRLRLAMLEERLPMDEALRRCVSPLLRGEAGPETSLAPDDLECLRELSARLGRGTAGEQALLLPQMRERLLQRRDEARARYQTLGRLYASLGALGALALALLFV